jgi:hypothetical protein
MFKKEPPQREPFWMDDPNPYSRAGSNAMPKGNPLWLLSRMFQVYAILVLVFLPSIFILMAIKFPLLWIFVALEVLFIARWFFLRRASKRHQAKVLRIQQLAREKTGAGCIGSALHTAGHPLLQVNQPVVLALNDSALSIYTYDNSTPVDTVLLQEIRAVDPVVFDDDYIPHVGIIDNTAQALQISIQRKNVEWICSFRRMYKVRSIEWYHAIQKARFAEKADPD